jgi:hypothetical protein
MKHVAPEVFLDCFRTAADNGHVEVVKLMMVQDPKKYNSEKLENAFVHAARRGHPSVLLFL